MLLLWVRVDLGTMAMKGYSIFPKAPALQEPQHQMVYLSNPEYLLGRGSYPSAEMQSMYSTDPADGIFCLVSLHRFAVVAVRSGMKVAFDLIMQLYYLVISLDRNTPVKNINSLCLT